MKNNEVNDLLFFRVWNKDRENDRPSFDDLIQENQSANPPKKKWTKPLLYPIKVNHKKSDFLAPVHPMHRNVFPDKHVRKNPVRKSGKSNINSIKNQTITHSPFIKIKEVKSAVRNWWFYLIIGILFTGLSLLLVFYPVESYRALVVFSACMFISGFLEIVFSTTNRKILPGWAWYLACGIIEVMMGVHLVFNPFVTAANIPLVLAFWMLFKGLTASGISYDLNLTGVAGWVWLSTPVIICTLVLIWNHRANAFASDFILALVSMFMGIFRIVLAYELRKHSRKARRHRHAKYLRLRLYY